MEVLLTLNGRSAAGGTPLLMHCERLADPLDEFTRAISLIAKKRNKSDADLLEIGRLEFLGGMYLDDDGPCLPAINILRCLQDGAKRQKKGQDVLRGIAPLTLTAPLAYVGPRDPEEMWKAGTFALRKSVGVQRARTMRTRPIFTDWSAVLPVEVDPTCWDSDSLAKAWADAGRYAGIGDMRPLQGRFEGVATEWTLRTDDGIGEASFALSSAIVARTIQDEDDARLARHGLIEDLLKGAIRAGTKINRAKEAALNGSS